MSEVIVTGSQGFIGSYICNDLLEHGYNVLGIDNFSKYGKVVRSHDNHPNFKLIEMDARELDDMDRVQFDSIDYIIAGAAMIGGISYFHKYAYDLLATNERILASTFDLAIDLHARHQLKRILVLSSSMVFESTDIYPTPESAIKTTPPPMSTYGFQKLASEYFCKGAYEQYGLPYTILRPFNCVGVGEEESVSEDGMEIGNVKMMMSHVLPDIVHRALVNGKDQPLTILGSGDQIRHYTNGKDIAQAIRLIMEMTKTVNQDYNISCAKSTTVKELAIAVWKELYGDTPLVLEHQEAFKYDVQKRIPDVSKLKSLGIECTTTLKESIREVIGYMKDKNDYIK